MTSFEEARDAFERLDMQSIAHYILRAMGLLEKGEKGRLAASMAELWMLEQGILNPARSMSAFVPLPNTLP